MKISKLVVFACCLLLLGAGLNAGSRWLHVRVLEPGQEGGSKVNVNVPLALVESVLPLIESEELKGGKLKVNDTELTITEMRKIWETIRTEGDYELASIDADGSRVRISKEGDEVFIRSVEGSETEVFVKVPVSVIDALLSGQGDELNLQAGIAALSEAATGDLVTVKDKETSVRIWIDESAASAQ